MKINNKRAKIYAKIDFGSFIKGVIIFSNGKFKREIR